MKLNNLELAMMNNPVRAWIQRRLETPLMIGAPGSLHGLRVLEVGCGRGVGIEILIEQLGAAEVVAFDIDPRMVALAQERTARFGDRVQAFVGNAERIDAPDGSFDAAVEFGILHHVPDWQRALHEIARVLKPGAYFYFEDILKGFTGAPFILNLFDHPQVTHFTGQEFRQAVMRAGLQLNQNWRQLGSIGLVGRARKAEYEGLDTQGGILRVQPADVVLLPEVQLLRRDHLSENLDSATATTRARYDRLAQSYDARQAFMERRAFERWRRELWSRIGSGRILEVGVGTGKNIPLYPDAASVTAIDLSPKMLERARHTAAAAGRQVDLRVMDAQALELPDAALDAAVSTFVFCSVPDAVAGLRELGRVVKPGGDIWLLEHVRVDKPLIGALMDLINPLVVRLMGANINRRTVQNVRAAGLNIVSVEHPGGALVKLIHARADAAPVARALS